MKPARIAVIGAGVAGVACAAALAAVGLAVTLFDKSRGPGGRMSTRRGTFTPIQGDGLDMAFDHGAQFFTARDPAFARVVQQGLREGWVAPWAPREVDAVSLDAHALEPRCVAVPGMPELARRLIGPGVQTCWSWPVAELQREPGSSPQRSTWRLRRSDGDQGWHPEAFDHVVLAMPPEQAAALLAAHRPDWSAQARATPMWPCWTLMALTEAQPCALPDHPAWPFDASRPSRHNASHPLGWLARNDSKPGRPRLPGLDAWVAQATPAWSQQHLECTPEQVVPMLLQALFEVIGQQPTVVHSAVHRWRFAQPARTPGQEATPTEPWWDASLHLGVCGDFLGGGGRVESAWLSGHRLAQSMLLCTNSERGTGLTPTTSPETRTELQTFAVLNTPRRAAPSRKAATASPQHWKAQPPKPM